MSSKRKPDRELNHDNWADEEEPEEVGVFQKAGEEELQKRQIRVAKRRLGGAMGESAEGKSNVFSGFSGFGSTAATTATTASKPLFNFGAFNAQTSTASSVLPESAKTFSFSSSNAAKLPAIEVKSTADSSKDNKKSSAFSDKLKELNKAVLECIKGHVDSGKLCILTPVFDDYKKFIKELEDGENEKPKSTASTFSFLSNSDKTNNNEVTSKASTASTFSFGASKSQPIETPHTSALPTSTKTTAAASTSATSTFTFGKPLPTFGGAPTPGAGLFGSLKPPEVQPAESSSDKPAEGENEEDEPPKVEFTPVVESDSLYSKRCKVFVKANNEFVSRGTGTLFIKEINNKKQLLVRADTNLGNILLNILFAPLPFKRMGKNNVSTICIPTPEAEQKPVQVLIRVKNEEEADELLAEIKKHQPSDS